MTRAIQHLELELGDRLFDRRAAGASLTSLGEAVRRELRHVPECVAAARSLAKTWMAGTDGHLRLGISLAAGSSGVAHFLGAFQRAHKGVTLGIEVGSTESITSRFNCGALDGMLIAAPQGLELRSGFRRLYQEYVGLVLPVGHSFAARDSVPPGLLDGQGILVNSCGDLRDCLIALLKAAGAMVTLACQGTRDDWLVEMAAQGVGIAVVPSGLAIPPGFVFRPLSSPVEPYEILLKTMTPAADGKLVRRIDSFALAYQPHQPEANLACVAGSSLASVGRL